MDILYSVKNFDVKFPSDLHVLRSPESKKEVFGNWPVRMHVWNLLTPDHHIPKTEKR